MPRFSDYHRTVIGYHGTSQSVVEKIVLLQEPIQWYDQSHDWMGNGVYYWEHAPKQAWRFAEIRRRQRKWDEPVAVVASMIRLGFCFDLLDPDNAKKLKSLHDDYIEVCLAKNQPIPKNKRRWKYLDKAVFDYAYSVINQEKAEDGSPSRVDTCRGIYVRPGSTGRLWKESWVQQGAFIQLLVKNPDCTLGGWLVPPDEAIDHE